MMVRSWLKQRRACGRSRIAILFEVLTARVPLIEDSDPLQLVESGREPAEEELRVIVDCCTQKDSSFWSDLDATGMGSASGLVLAILNTVRKTGWKVAAAAGAKPAPAAAVKEFLSALEDEFTLW